MGLQGKLSSCGVRYLHRAKYYILSALSNLASTSTSFSRERMSIILFNLVYFTLYGVCDASIVADLKWHKNI